MLAAATEHHAVLDSVRWLAEHEGAEADWLPVGPTGVVSRADAGRGHRADPATVAVISVMWANNEVGTVQPIAELAAAGGRVPDPVPQRRGPGGRAAAGEPGRASGATALTITAHKIGGPVGYRRAAAGQGRRAGAGPARRRPGARRPVRARWTSRRSARSRSPCRSPRERRADEAKRIAPLRDDLIAQVLAAVPDAMLNGAAPGPGRLPGNAHFSFPGCEGDALLMLLDARGIACSTGSACTAGVAQPSHVLLAMGADEARARGSLRFSLGHTSEQSDVDALGAVIGEVVERARRAAR